MNTIENKIYGKTKNIKLYRTIFLNSIDELEIQNIGCHFTKSQYYTHTGGGECGNTIEKKVKVKIVAILTKKQFDSFVNIDATSISNEEYPHEQEVVLNQYTNIKFYAEVKNRLENGLFSGKVADYIEFNGNTGSRVDSWVNKL